MALSSSICDCLCLFSPSLSHSPSHPELPTHQHLLCCALRLKLISCRNVNAVNVLPPLLPFNFYMTTHCPPTSRQSSAPTSRAALTCLQHEIRLAHGPEFGAHRVLYGPDDCLLRGAQLIRHGVAQGFTGIALWLGRCRCLCLGMARAVTTSALAANMNLLFSTPPK